MAGISKKPSTFTGRDGVGESVALLFGPENGAVSEKLVHEVLKEANLRGYTHLYVSGKYGHDSGNIRSGNPRHYDGRPIEKYAFLPDIQRLWTARGKAYKGKSQRPRTPVLSHKGRGSLSVSGGVAWAGCT